MTWGRDRIPRVRISCRITRHGKSGDSLRISGWYIKSHATADAWQMWRGVVKCADLQKHKTTNDYTAYPNHK